MKLSLHRVIGTFCNPTLLITVRVNWFACLFILLLAGAYSTAQAQTITIGDNATIVTDDNFGGTSSPHFVSGEFFSVPPGATTLTSFTFQLEEANSNESSTVQAYAVAYNTSTGATGSLYTSSSAPVTLTTQGYSPKTFNFNVPVLPDATYIVFLSSIGLTQGTGSNQVYLGLATPDSPGLRQNASATLTGLSVSAIGYAFSLNNTYDVAFSATFLTSIGSNYATPYTFSTLVGSGGNNGSSDGTGSAALFNGPTGVALGGHGTLFVTDTNNQTLREISTAGVVTTLAGSAGQAGASDGSMGSIARFDLPKGVALDGTGNIYVADSFYDTIRKIVSSGAVSTFVGHAGEPGSTDGTGASATFKDPEGVAVDGSGNLYVADSGNSTIRKITPGGVVTTFAGLALSTGSTDGTGSAAQFNHPTGVAVDSTGNIYVADSGNSTIRKITPGGVVTTLAGTAGVIGSSDGTGPAALFDSPYGVAVDVNGNVYVADTGNSAIRLITPGGVVTTLAGNAGHPGSTDGTGSAAGFSSPAGILVDRSGTLYVADSGNDTIRKGTPPTPNITVSGNLAFGNVTVNTTPTSTLTINNTGAAPLTVSSISYPSGFSGNWSGVIPAGGSQPVTVTFAPTSAITYSGTLTVNSNASSGASTIAISGTGTATASPSISVSGNLAFGNVTVNTTATRALTINNTGTAPLTVSGISYPNGFSGSWSGAIPAGGSQPVTVTFSPTSAISYSGTVTVNSNASGGIATTVISGMGVSTTLNSQTISAFSTIASVTYGVAPFAITLPTASSGLPVTVTVRSGPATISGNTVTITGTGTVVLAADQVGNASYSAAPEVTTRFTVSAATGADFLGGVATTSTLRHSPWFGYYTFASFPLIYQYNLGYEYAYNAGGGGVYLYDYTSSHFWYTSATDYPFVYDFSLNVWLYYYIANTPHRHFYEFGVHPGVISE